MDKKEKSVCIIGAGISGLIAATVLEKHGYIPVIYEKTESAGGRVKTSSTKGYLLDHGFQVLLDAYPKAKQYLDYDSLLLQKFLPGAVIFRGGKQKMLGDASRKLALAIPTLLSGIGNLSDKLKIVKLNSALKKKSIEAIFLSEEKTTLLYLQEKGFSEGIINDFFKPFFSGIFLESELNTSSRMFEFVFKMFGEGNAVIPEKGIGAIPGLLTTNLKTTKFNYGRAVTAVSDDKIILENGERIDYDALIIATETTGIVDGITKDRKWKSCVNFYFKTATPVIDKALIGLIADKDALINNIYYPSFFQESKDSAKHYISVTVVKDHNFSKKELEIKVREELKSYCNIEVSELIEHYSIPRALPELKDLKYDITPESTLLKNAIFQAGDHLLFGSLNAAMISGERAAEGVIAFLEKS